MKSKIYWAIIIGLIASSSCTKKEPVNRKRPNILFIMSDDHANRAISAYDSSLIMTPNIDRIALGGMTFTNGCVTNSICAPSRATILTGKHTHIHGKRDNISVFDTTQQTFPQIFQRNGYQTAFFGKLHFGNNPKGFDEFMVLPGQGNYINPTFNHATGDTTIEGYVTDITTDMTLNWLEREKDSEEPFMLFYWHKAPHRPWWPKPEKFAEYTKKRFPEPSTLFDDFKTRGTAAKTAEMNLLHHMTHMHDTKIRPETLALMGKETGPSPNEPNWQNSFYGPYNRASEAQQKLYDPTIDSINQYFKENWPKMSDKEKMSWKYQRYMQDYLGCISTLDENIGRVLDYLEENGLAENTIVIYTSDQGFYLGEHGWFDKRFMYEESFKTPILMKWPKLFSSTLRSDEMVQNLDFAPTLLEAAGIPIPNDMQGESFLPLLNGNLDKWTRDAVYYHYYQYPSIHMVKRHYGVVTKTHKLIHFYNDVDEWELYDRINDPNELNNLYDQPGHEGLKKQLLKKLDEMREKYNDRSDTENYNPGHQFHH